ncbi:LysM peptidoglycan-binding domain-containing protein [Phaeacidiphilus oryzae]|jgi:nucleoid-associated protein YgaU|uniref:LysM peptidoglycan-binding domain-containing protein n=1 Tax=Phaeacidiphilus oryzae TaxID=348818 RepID=UPI000567871F|nr:transglycosylase family protein [Phaeacidiphilus oryzae]
MIFRRENVAVRAAVIAGLAVAAPAVGVLANAGSASAASTSQWDHVAQLESGGDWHANTGNGYYGGLQFSQSTWAAYGGTAYAANASEASKSEQIAVAERVLASQGPGAWPNTGYGLTKGGSTSAGVSRSAGVHHHSRSTANTSHTSEDAVRSTGSSAVHHYRTGSGDYTVRSGDTLSSIAAHKGISWTKLYERNRSTIGADPNLIFVGQRLDV